VTGDSSESSVTDMPLAPPGGQFTPAASATSPFWPIGSYGFLSDRESLALVAPDGGVEWMCVPRPDSPSVFTAMLDRAAGSFRVGPPDRAHPAGRRYLPGTNVLETTWQTDSGWLIVTDALLVGPWEENDERDAEYVRPPGDHKADKILVRLMECINGSVDVELSCDPVFDYGRTDARWSYAGRGYGDALAHGRDGDPRMRLTTGLRVGFEGRTAVAYQTFNEGERSFVSLSWDDRADPPVTTEQAAERLERTADYWRGWLNRGWFPDHPWRSLLQRSALTLKGLTYTPTGALLASATTSLPEALGGERNWDYRYSWVRDSTFALWGLYTLGFGNEAKSFFNFVQDRVRDSGRLQVMYGIGGEAKLEESSLDHLSGYEHSRPVRVGNAAYQQDQHDVWGALLDSIYLHHRAGEFLGDDVWRGICEQVEAAIEHWREPDRGIWEIRGEPRHFTTSKIMCWVACDRGARLAEATDHGDLGARWQSAADEIHADILANGVSKKGVLTQAYGSDALDASLLLAPLLRFLPVDDERIRSTVFAIEEHLTVDGMVRRYDPADIDDGVGGREGTFAICSFWLVSALVEIGETARAHTLLEKLIGAASPLGLYAEEIDPRSGRHLGNFPQAFTHLALINAVVHVIRSESQTHPHRFQPR
jgi:alpha,alpha-trehalase